MFLITKCTQQVNKKTSIKHEYYYTITTKNMYLLVLTFNFCFQQNMFRFKLLKQSMIYGNITVYPRLIFFHRRKFEIDTLFSSKYLLNLDNKKNRTETY